MKKEQLIDIQNAIYREYGGRMWIHFGENDEEYYSRILQREVVIPLSAWENPTEWSVFALLHEVGHVMTNHRKMKRYEQEYSATQWAIDEAKRKGFKVTYYTIKVYQDYIYQWRDISIKLKAKNVAPRESLTLRR